MSLAKRLTACGLRTLGQCQDGTDRITLVGPDEPRFWSIFRESPEYQDGLADPLDRWSQRIITMVAAAEGGTPEFPFGGPPYAPFQSWAAATGQAWPSPIGFLVHADVGLFVSFRGAIRQPGTVRTSSETRPCDGCLDQPCLTACPVAAFDDGYDVARCKAHVRSPAGLDCRQAGCLARRVCPVGQGRRLPAQAAFHMEAFL